MKICGKCDGEGWTEGVGDCQACHGTGMLAGRAKIFAPRARAFRQPPRHPEGNPFFDELQKRVEISAAARRELNRAGGAGGWEHP
jgi:hypothetical protein